jgi:S-DNA-T family DNA segregation ATPase FtsK/SpoIIIE
MIKPNNVYTRKSNEKTGKPLPGKIVKLLIEARWFVLAVLAVYLIISLVSYTKADPAWSHATANASIHNLGGRIGAWLADLLLFMFGASTWLLFVPIVTTMVRGYGQIANGFVPKDGEEDHPYEWMFTWSGFSLLMLGSVGLEHLRLSALGMSLPRAPGGVIGELLSGAALSPFGYAGATMLFVLMCALGVSLYFRVSWISVAEKIGLLLEKSFAKAVLLISGFQDRRIGHMAAVRRDESILHERSRPHDEPSPDPTPRSHAPVRVEPALFDEQVSERSHLVRPVEPRFSPNIAEVEETSIEVASSIERSARLVGEVEGEGDLDSNVIPIASAVKRVEVRATAPVAIAGVNAGSMLRVEDPAPIHIVKQVVSIPKSDQAERERQTGLFPHLNATKLPAVSLLDEAPQSVERISEETLEFTSRLIEKKLNDFGISVKVVSAFPGPVITRYEIEPAVGVKGSAIVNLARDLSRALSLTSIRVVEVIPGKNYMGLELPNAKRQIVRLTEIIGSKSYAASASNLTVALGKDISGNAVVADLAKMPHLLVAGTTGSGKSVGINATILSLLYKADPNDVRLILIDPKMLEMSVYEGIPHLLAPVVTDMNQAGHALNWAVNEMERRYKLMSKLGVRNLAGYNEKIVSAKAVGESFPNPFSLTPDAPEPLDKLPNIVIVIDELADLMMVVGKKVEELIARIAQKARAAGIHLILATQRPSVDVITGLIKANIPTRIAFQVSSKIDSRTILDQMGAETLLGMGDMLYQPPGTSDPVRVHGAFVSDDEVHRVVGFLKEQGSPNYIDGILEGGVMSDSAGGNTATSGGSGESDEMYDQAVSIVLKNNKASISLVQRHLRIGYNRAARLLEQMEANGVVSTMQNNGNREILAPQHGAVSARGESE